MASVSVKYSCGCGFQTDKLEEAVQHSDNQNHTLTVLGTVHREKQERGF